MVDLNWHVPAKPVDPPTALRRILAQHREIRVLLQRARELGLAALEQSETTRPDSVASTIGDLRTAMEVHMTFEEKVLLPLYQRVGTDGVHRTAALLTDHTNQRAMLAALHREAETAPMLPTLAVKLTFLATWLLSDMADEERTLHSQLS
jgi:iron-sulfur cluster repair protein YtfE (RIC family)